MLSIIKFFSEELRRFLRILMDLNQVFPTTINNSCDKERLKYSNTDLLNHNRLISAEKASLLYANILTDCLHAIIPRLSVF